MSYVLYETEDGAYYGGINPKYTDIFNYTVKECAKELIENDALRIRDILNKAGYSFVLKEVNQ